jgi:hypothetical protein
MAGRWVEDGSYPSGAALTHVTLDHGAAIEKEGRHLV